MTSDHHFWDNPIIALNIADVAEMMEEEGPDYNLDGVMRDTWTDILHEFFRNQFANSGDLFLRVFHRPYRGYPSTQFRGSMPTAVIEGVRFDPADNNRPVPGTRRDILWVEPKALNKSSPPIDWSDILGGLTHRLGNAHETRRVYVLVVFGMKWMPFLWDPETPMLNPLGSPLRAQTNGTQAVGEETFTVDHRLCMISPEMLPGQKHITREPDGTLRISPDSAYTLDYWLQDQDGNLANLEDLLLLGKFFDLVKTTEYQGENPNWHNANKTPTVPNLQKE